MNKYLSELGYQGPNTLLALIILMLYLQGETNQYAYGAVILCKFVNHIINISIKNSLKAPRPDSHKDPNFANLKPTFKNFFTVHKQFGMPSGHAQDTVFELTFIAIYFKKPWLTLVALAQVLLTLWQRYENRRHSIKQLAVGSVLGLLVGLAFYKIYNHYFTVEKDITIL
jgi:membrane-associated phospholipid phosphatase